MSTIRPKLLNELIGKKLGLEFEKTLGLMKQGFDVAVQPSSKNLHLLFCELCESEICTRQLSISIAKSWEEASDEKLQQDRSKIYTPILLILMNPPPSGSGFIVIPLPSLESLLPSINTTVSTILDCSGLMTYEEVFDARKMSKIKQIASTQNLGIVIDAVVNVAYIAGVHGDEDRADEYLKALALDFAPLNTTDMRAPFPRVIDEILKATQHPHSYLKAALSYYVVRSQGNSMTRSSRLLNISRTTLQQHLRLAENFKVCELFGDSQS